MLLTDVYPGVRGSTRWENQPQPCGLTSVLPLWMRSTWCPQRSRAPGTRVPWTSRVGITGSCEECTLSGQPRPAESVRGVSSPSFCWRSSACRRNHTWCWTPACPGTAPGGRWYSPSIPGNPSLRAGGLSWGAPKNLQGKCFMDEIRLPPCRDFRPAGTRTRAPLDRSHNPGPIP